MKVIYENSFLKDIKKLDSKVSLKLKNIILKIEVTKNLSDLDNIKKMIWFKFYYRIRIWDYRLGIKIQNSVCTFIRLKHRKDIYKIFP